jgi:RNA polymerase sigma-70 factor (ECF subfamily)
VVCAAARGDRAALAVLEDLLAEVPRHISRITRARAVVDAIRQHLRAALVAAAPGAATYRGRGPLRSWLRVAAVRAALNERRAEERVRRRETAAPEPTSAARDPELDLMKARYRPEVTRAIEDALRALEPDRRLRASPSEVTSILTIVRSDIWVSVSRLLSNPAPADA